MFCLLFLQNIVGTIVEKRFCIFVLILYCSNLFEMSFAIMGDFTDTLKVTLEDFFLQMFEYVRCMHIFCCSSRILIDFG